MKHLMIRRKSSDSPYRLLLNPAQHLKDKYDFRLDLENTGLKNFFEQRIILRDFTDKYIIELKLVGIEADDIFISLRDNTMILKTIFDGELIVEEVIFRDKIDKDSIEAQRRDEIFVMTLIKDNK